MILLELESFTFNLGHRFTKCMANFVCFSYFDVPIQFFPNILQIHFASRESLFSVDRITYPVIIHLL